MKKQFLTVFVIGAVVVPAFLLFETSESQTAGSFIALQSSTPGTAQNGSFNINGTGRMSFFVMPTGASLGRVLTSSSTGVGTWQTLDPLPLPYSDSITLAGTAFSITNSANGGIALRGTGGATGVLGTSEFGSGIGLYGRNEATTGTGRGVYGTSACEDGVGVYGNAFGTGYSFGGRFKSAGTDSDSAGVLAEGYNGVYAVGSRYGGYFATFGTNGYTGIVGNCIGSNLATTFGGSFTTDSAAGTGVFGAATRTFGTTFGGSFTNSSSSGTAVKGTVTSFSGTTYGGYFTIRSEHGGALYASAESNDGDSFGVQGQTAAPSGVGVYAIATSTTGSARGLYAKTSATGGAGLISIADAISGTTYGGYFLCGSTNGTGVYSQASAGTGQTAGGYFQSDSTSGTGAIGWASATSGTTTGVYGECISPDGTGVFGESFATAGVSYGVRGKVASPNGRAVYGESTATTGTSYGVYGETASTSGRGVYGVATTNSGGTVPYGVRGFCNLLTSGFALYAAGNTGASGTKSFRIDHPLDPENYYLMHYSTESPEPQNFYNGTIVTDASGYAWVELPDYFEEINRDFKYSLTIVDDADSAEFVMSKVSKKIRNNRFQIRTSRPKVEVCWRIDAVRNDLYCRFQKPQSEVKKTEGERGMYQHPELYNKPASLGMDFQR